MIRRFLVVGGLLVLLASAGLNYYLFRQLTGVYRNEFRVRLDPANLSYYPAEAGEPAASDQRTVVFFGDSHAEGWIPPDGLTGFAFANRGIGAQTSAQARLRFDAHVQPLEPDVLVIQICTNDMLSIPLFPQRRDEIIANCRGNLAALVDQARAIGATTILTTVFPVRELPLPWVEQLIWSGDFRQPIEVVNDYIRSLAAEGVIIFDTYALLVDEDGRLRADFSRDGLHLNAAGYALLNSELAGILQTIREQPEAA
jgi:lysophospholipase L1-like esterase